MTEAVLNDISGSCGGIASVYRRHDWAAEKRAALHALPAQVLAVAQSVMNANRACLSLKKLMATFTASDWGTVVGFGVFAFCRFSKNAEL